MRKVLNIIVIILDVLLIALLCFIKIGYYIDVNAFKFDNIYDIGYCVLWVPISMLITLSPMLTQIAIIAFVKFKKQLFSFLGLLYCLIGDYVFEFISVLGGTMCLSDKWITVSVTIMKALILTLIPFIVSLAAFIVDTVKNKRAPKPV